VDIGSVLEIGHNDPTPAQLSAAAVTRGPLDKSHVSTKVGEQHRGMRPGPHASEFDDLYARQRARRCLWETIRHALSLDMI
jgi:hypothetical protein